MPKSDIYIEFFLYIIMKLCNSYTQNIHASFISSQELYCLMPGSTVSKEDKQH